MDPIFLSPVARAIVALEAKNPSDERIDQLRQTLDPVLAGRVLSETNVDSAALGARIQRYSGKKMVIEQLNTEIAAPSKRVKTVDLESPIEEEFLLAREETHRETKVRRYQDLIRNPEIRGETQADAMYNLAVLLGGEDELSLYRGIVNEPEALSETKAHALYNLALKSTNRDEKESLLINLLREPDASDGVKIGARTSLAKIHFETNPDQANSEFISIIYDSEFSQFPQAQAMLLWGMFLKMKDPEQAIRILTILKDDRKTLPSIRSLAKRNLGNLMLSLNRDTKEEFFRALIHDEDFTKAERTGAKYDLATIIFGTNPAEASKLLNEVINEPEATPQLIQRARELEQALQTMLNRKAAVAKQEKK